MATATAVAGRVIIEKGPRRGTPERIEVWSNLFEGQEMTHARTFYQDEREQWMPSPRGFSLDPELAIEVGEAMIRCARQQLGEKGATP